MMTRKLLFPSLLTKRKNISLRKLSLSATKILNSYNNSAERSDAETSYVIESKFAKIQLPKADVNHQMWLNLDRDADKTAVVCGSTGRSFSYHDLYKKSKYFSANLRQKLGIKKGQVLGVFMPNIPEYLIAVLACIDAGIKVATFNPLYTKNEVLKQALDADVKLFLTTNQLYTIVNQVCVELEETKQKPNIEIITVKTNNQDSSLPGNAIKFDELCLSGDETRNKFENFNENTASQPDSNDTVLLLYSSGTTGLPKGVEISQSNLATNLVQMNTPNVSFLKGLPGSEQIAVPLVLPLYHAYGLIAIFMNLFRDGVKLVTLPKFEPESFLNILTKYRPMLFQAVPPIVLFLLNHPAVKDKHLEVLKKVYTAAAPLGATDRERFLEKTKGNTILMQAYGLTETSPITHMQTVDDDIDPNGSGWLVANTRARIVSPDTGRVVHPMETGELQIQGPQVMKGYHGNAEATASVIDGEGWFRTGDIGHHNERGEIFITDRLKELIKVKGLQVAPAELEALLRDHPSIGDAAVVGVAHPRLGEAPKAFLVPKHNQRINIDEITAYVRANAAEYKQLAGGIEIINEIPKTPSGKILRRELRDK